MRLLALLGVTGALLGADAPGEYEVKAAFLYNFAKFVEWPGEAMPMQPRFSICVFGEEQVSERILPVVDGRQVGGRAVAVRTLSDAASAGDCQILFAAGTEAAEAARGLALPGVLTVGESSGFARDGGMISFVFIDKKVRFEINKKSAEQAGLSISSKLLKLAHDVYE